MAEKCLSEVNCPGIEAVPFGGGYYVVGKLVKRPPELTTLRVGPDEAMVWIPADILDDGHA